MNPDRLQTYYERLVYHRRFYIPAALCLFLCMPGSLAAFLPSNLSTPLYVAQRMETVLIYAICTVTYSLLLVWALPKDLKIIFGFLCFVFSLLLTPLFMRNTLFSANSHLAVLRWDTFRHFLPGALMFFLLVVLDQKKRDKKIFWSLITLMLPLSILSAVNKKAVQFLDFVRYSDVRAQLIEREPPNTFMVEQCGLIADIDLRASCTVALDQFRTSETYCEETGDVNPCELSRGEHARSLSAHPVPQKIVDDKTPSAVHP